MDFVDDINFVPRLCRGIVYALDKLPDVVDPGMAGGVYLDDVQSAPLCDRFTHGAFVAGFAFTAGRGFDAVHGLGQNTPGAGFACAPGAAEQVGVGHIPP